MAEEQEIAKLTKQMDLMDQRLDNIDSMVTAVAERVMSQPIVMLIACPHCHKNIEITLIGTGKLTK